MGIFVFFAGTIVGILIIRYVSWFYYNVSKLPFFERYIGSGGGVTGWRLIGILVIVGSWIAAFSDLL
jgi:hypothetical protein